MQRLSGKLSVAALSCWRDANIAWGQEVTLKSWGLLSEEKSDQAHSVSLGSSMQFSLIWYIYTYITKTWTTFLIKKKCSFFLSLSLFLHSEGLVVKDKLISHRGWASSVAWHPTSNLLVSGAHDGSITSRGMISHPNCQPYLHADLWKAIYYQYGVSVKQGALRFCKIVFLET